MHMLWCKFAFGIFLCHGAYGILFRVCSCDVIKFSDPKLESNQRFYPHRVLEILNLYLVTTSSSVAPFVWKPAHFEFRSYDGA